MDRARGYAPSQAEESDLGNLLSEAIATSRHLEAVFVTRTGRCLGARKLSGYHFKRLIEKAGAPNIRFYDLRHAR